MDLQDAYGKTSYDDAKKSGNSEIMFYMENIYDYKKKFIWIFVELFLQFGHLVNDCLLINLY